MRIIQFLLALIILIYWLSVSSVNAEERTKELYLNNEAGGVIALTVEPCSNVSAFKMGFVNRAYATESNKTIHEGCWFGPGLNDAPPSTDQMRIIPLINTWWDGTVITYEKNQFAPMSSTNTI